MNNFSKWWKDQVSGYCYKCITGRKNNESYVLTPSPGLNPRKYRISNYYIVFEKN